MPKNKDIQREMLNAQIKVTVKRIINEIDGIPNYPLGKPRLMYLPKELLSDENRNIWTDFKNKLTDVGYKLEYIENSNEIADVHIFVVQNGSGEDLYQMKYEQEGAREYLVKSYPDVEEYELTDLETKEYEAKNKFYLSDDLLEDDKRTEQQ